MADQQKCGPSNGAIFNDMNDLKPKPDFKVTPLLTLNISETVREMQTSYNEILIGTYALVKTVISNDLEIP